MPSDTQPKPDELRDSLSEENKEWLASLRYIGLIESDYQSTSTGQPLSKKIGKSIPTPTSRDDLEGLPADREPGSTQPEPPTAGDDAPDDRASRACPDQPSSPVGSLATDAGAIGGKGSPRRRSAFGGRFGAAPPIGLFFACTTLAALGLLASVYVYDDGARISTSGNGATAADSGPAVAVPNAATAATPTITEAPVEMLQVTTIPQEVADAPAKDQSAAAAASENPERAASLAPAPETKPIPAPPPAVEANLALEPETKPTLSPASEAKLAALPETKPAPVQAPQANLVPRLAAKPTAQAALGVQLQALVSRGDALLEAGDVTAARLYYRRGAEHGDGAAALRLGETFDPAFLTAARLGHIGGDPQQAFYWYRRAYDLGNRDAAVILKSFPPHRQ